MKKNILFIQGGGGEESYTADAGLVESLRRNLVKDFEVHYPLLNNESAPDFGRIKQIKKEIEAIDGDVILVGHSLGASMLLKYLSENQIKKKIPGIFLISTPFWSGDEDWVQSYKLTEDFADKLPQGLSVFLYHCRDDEEVPFEHLSLYAQKLPQAAIREMRGCGHQLNNDLSLIAEDIKSL